MEQLKTFKELIHDDLLEGGNGLNGLELFRQLYINNSYRDFLFYNYDTISHTEYDITHTLLHSKLPYSIVYEIINNGGDASLLTEELYTTLFFQKEGEVMRYLIENGASLNSGENNYLRFNNGITMFCGDRDLDAVKLLLDNDISPFIYSQPYDPKEYIYKYSYNNVLINMGFDIYNNYIYSKKLVEENYHYISYRLFKPNVLHFNGMAFIHKIESLNYIKTHYIKIKKITEIVFKKLINKKNMFNENVLFYVKEPKLFNWFLDNGCNPNCINIMGYNLLQYHTDLRLIKLLLKYGGNITYNNPYFNNNYYNQPNRYISVIDYHLFIKNYKVWEYLYRYKATLIIQKNWKIFIGNKKWKHPDIEKIYKDVMLSLEYAPPVHMNIEFFEGGIKYIESYENFKSQQSMEIK